jgi:hypothetical protein
MDKLALIDQVDLVEREEREKRPLTPVPDADTRLANGCLKLTVVKAINKFIKSAPLKT